MNNWLKQSTLRVPAGTLQILGNMSARSSSLHRIATLGLTAACALLFGGFSCFASAQAGPARTPATQNAAAPSGEAPDAPADAAGNLPKDPKGRSTVIGGRIHHLDRVRDEFVLMVYGGHPMKILYDPRTKLYRDGTPAPLSSIKPDERASVQTTLDGTKLFALSIHTLTKAPKGSCTGQVEAYDPSVNRLTVRCGMNTSPVKFLLPNGVSVSRVSQQKGVSTPATVSELTRGTLVSVTFRPGSGDHAIAQHIDITATPGSAFVFRGALVFLDMHAGRLVVQDSKGDSNYSISFSPDTFPASRDLHPGTRVTVVADFDGTRYVATSIQAD